MLSSSELPQEHLSKTATTRVRVTFSDNQSMNTTTGTNQDFYNWKLLLQPTHYSKLKIKGCQKQSMEFLAKKNEAILKDFHDCVIRNDEIRLKDISP